MDPIYQRRGMQNNMGKQFKGILGYTVVLLLLVLGTFYVISHIHTDAAPVARAADQPRMDAVWPWDEFFLLPDKTHKVGKVWLTYRGKVDADHFLIDVTIPDLDPEMYYRHKLSIAAARKGFSLVGEDYRLLKIKESSIQLQRG